MSARRPLFPVGAGALTAAVLLTMACGGRADDDSNAEALEIEVTVEEPIDTPGIDEV